MPYGGPRGLFVLRGRPRHRPHTPADRSISELESLAFYGEETKKLLDNGCKFGFLLFSAIITTQCQGKVQSGQVVYEGTLPSTLTIVSLSAPVTKIDLQGSGVPNDLAIKGYEETGTAYAPTIYMFLTYDGSDLRDKYHVVWMPESIDQGDFYSVSKWTSGDCFGVITTLFSGEIAGMRRYFLVKAERDPSVTENSVQYGSNIVISIYYPKKINNIPGNNFAFYKIMTRSERSHVCNEKELYVLIEKIFSIKINGGN